MRVRLGVALALGLSVGAALAPASARTYLAIPKIDWEGLEPYVRANIVPTLDGDDFHVYVCSGQTCRSTVKLYDEAVGDFTKALLYQLVATDRHFKAAIEASVTDFRRRVPSLSSDERERYREIYWQSLNTLPDILPRVRREFHSAQHAGRLRCWACEEEPSAYPAAVRFSK